MSQLLIQQYLNQLASLKKVSGTTRESVVREAFKDLLKGWARSHDLVFVPEYEIASPTKERRYVDGALLHALRMPFGYWEAKDEKDDLAAEIAYKFKRGYPQDNIIFEDSTEAVLIQNRQEVMRCAVEDVEQHTNCSITSKVPQNVQLATRGSKLGLFQAFTRPAQAENESQLPQTAPTPCHLPHAQ